jgi:hypothetical protein
LGFWIFDCGLGWEKKGAGNQGSGNQYLSSDICARLSRGVLPRNRGEAFFSQSEM